MRLLLTSTLTLLLTSTLSMGCKDKVTVPVDNPPIVNPPIEDPPGEDTPDADAPGEDPPDADAPDSPDDPPASDAGTAAVVDDTPKGPKVGETTMSFSEVKEKSDAAIAKREYKEAEALWGKYVLEAPSDKQGVFELGRVYYLMGDLEAAKKQAEVACFLKNEDGCVQAKLIAEQIKARP